MKRLTFFSLIAATLLQPSFTQADSFSTSIMRPTPVEMNGVIRGPLTNAKATYYFSVEAKSGELLTQLTLRGTQGADKQLEFALLNSSARVQDSYWVHGTDASSEATKSFSIDSTGKKVLKVTIQGPETGHFCVLLGGDAFPTTGEQECWPAANNAGQSQSQNESGTPDLRTAKIEVVEAKCEQRLRIGSDVLFDFDKADTRSEAAPTLNTAAQYLKKATHSARIEGHTDGKGADTYNQALSEKRAASVRNHFVQQGIEAARISSVGFGKTRPVAPNTHADGSDDPDGRQKNRRVEIVIDTCDRTASAGK